MKKITLLIASLFLVVGLSAQIFENLYLIGDATAAGWDNNNPIQGTKVEEGVFTWTATLNAPSPDQRFKFLTEVGTWINTITCQITENGHETVVLGQEMDLFLKGDPYGGYDNAFQVETTDQYRIDVDLNTMKMTIIAASTVGISTISKDDVPFKATSIGGVINITMSDASMVDNFEVYNIAGSMVASKSNVSNRFSTDAQLTSGVYVVKVRSNNKVYSSKVIVR